MGKRHFFIDQLRAFAIFLIVFEHNDHSSILSELSTSFSIPLFFVLSGLVSGDKSKLYLKTFIGKQVKRLLIPYFSLSFLLFLFWLLLGRHYGESASKAYEPVKNFIGIFYAQGGPEYMNWGIPMWFLPALFLVGVFDYFVSKLNFYYRLFPAFFLPAIGWFLFWKFETHLPWSFDVALAMYGFYFFGHLIRKANLVELLSKWRIATIYAILFFTIHILCFHLNGRILYYYSDYGNFLLMYLNGLAGFLWVFALFSLFPTFRVVVWIGQNTLPILAFHLLAMTFMKGLAILGFGVELHFNIWLSFIYGLLQIALVAPIIFILNRYFPFLVGTDRRKDFGIPQNKG